MSYVEVPADEVPDPRIEALEQLREMPVPTAVFVPQPHLEKASTPSLQRRGVSEGMRGMNVSFTYMFFLDPDDRMAPENLAELDPDTERALEEAADSAGPSWLVEMMEEMRFPQLWEAVRTSWHRDEDESSSLDALLLEHAEHVLRNCFRTQRGLEGFAGGLPPAPDLSESALQRPAFLVVDGVELEGARIDTDPHVYAIGAELPSGGTATGVVPRDKLDHIRLELKTHQP
ncbi:hypothetical protein [Microbacterium oryzae]|nr:hypothetical protein [Microbacterium oryzae]